MKSTLFGALVLFGVLSMPGTVGAGELDTYNFGGWKPSGEGVRVYRIVLDSHTATFTTESIRSNFSFGIPDTVVRTVKVLGFLDGETPEGYRPDKPWDPASERFREAIAGRYLLFKFVEIQESRFPRRPDAEAFFSSPGILNQLSVMTGTPGMNKHKDTKFSMPIIVEVRCKKGGYEGAGRVGHPEPWGNFSYGVRVLTFPNDPSKGYCAISKVSF